MSILQVSDRQLTIVPTGRPFDDAANKAILFCAADAQVCLGYSGTAYVGRVTTDQWIAEILCGSPIVNGPRGGPSALTVSTGHRPADIGRVVDTLRAKLAAQPAISIEILLAGWQLHGKGWRAIWIELKKNASTFAVTMEKSERYFYWSQHHPHDVMVVPHYPKTLHPTPERNPLSRAEIEAVAKQVGEAGEDTDKRIDLLWAAIRLASEHSTVVGKECMSISLPYPAYGPAQVRFHSARTHHVQSGQTVLPVTFTPWVIGPRTMSAPSVINVAFSVPFGWSEVLIEPPPQLDEPRLRIISSQRRPRGP